ncbi:MAG TPA: hypothetical protein VNP96_03510 [Solirubrobacterales bacterium]|nr:hypothetical protein [Solirubrobacterales bacterium]
MKVQLKTPARLLTALGAALMALVLMAPMAQGATPAPGYTQFAGCPDQEENSATTVCLRSEINGGHFQMGSKTVPITDPIVLSGGADENLDGFDASPAGGLAPNKQQVPGGVIGITGLDWLVNFLGIEQLKLYAETQLVGTPDIDFTEVKLPIRVRLINPVLGNSCYVGSPSEPIMLNLTTGTTEPPPPNEPISGTFPSFEFDEGTGILKLNDGVYVDNEFAAPGANGCKLTLLGLLPINLNPLVNLQAGLPSPAGTNETVQNFDAEFAPQELVYP